MKPIRIITHLVSMLISWGLLGSCTNKEQTYLDDRLCDHPCMDILWEIMISDCKHRSDLNRNPEFDTTVYYVTFNFFSMNDTNKVWVMGRYEEPFICHDKKGFNGNHYIGYFKRKNVYCYIYESLFDSLHQGKMKQSPIINVFLRDWSVKKQLENSEFIPDYMGDVIQDPFMFEYMIDSLGNCTLVKKGYW